MAAATTNPVVFEPSDILTPAELAARLKVNPQWVYEQMRPSRKNPVPVLRAGRFLRFSWTAVCQWMLGHPTLFIAKEADGPTVIGNLRNTKAGRVVVPITSRYRGARKAARRS